MASASMVAEAFVSIRADMSGFHKDMNKAKGQTTSQISGMASSIGSALSSAIGGALAIAGGVAIGGGIAGALGINKAIHAAADFEQAMTDAVSIFDLPQSQEKMAFGNLEKLALQMGRDTKFSAEQAARGLEKLALSGLNVEESMSALPHALTLAAAGHIDIATSAQIASNTMKAFGQDANFLSRVNDVLTTGFTKSNTDILQLSEAMKPVAPVAKLTGTSLEDTAAILSRMADSGYTGSMAGTALRNALVRLSGPTKEAQETLDRLGISVENFGKKGGPGIIDIMEQFEKANIDVADAAAILGVRGAPQLLGAMEQIDSAGRKGTASIKALSAVMSDPATVGVAGRMAEKRLDTFTGQGTVLASSIQVMFKQIGKPILEFTKPIVQELIKAFNFVSTIDFGSGFFKDLKVLFTDGVQGVRDFGNAIGINEERLKEWSKTIAQIFRNGLGNLRDFANRAAEFLNLGSLSEVFSGTGDFISRILTGLERLSADPATSFEWIGTSLELAISQAIDNVRASLAPMTAAFEGASAAVSMVLESMKVVLESIVNVIIESFTPAWNVFSSVASAALSLVEHMLGNFVGLMKQIGDDIASVMKFAFGGLYTVMIQPFVDAIDFIGRSLQAVLGNMPGGGKMFGDFMAGLEAIKAAGMDAFNASLERNRKERETTEELRKQEALLRKQMEEKRLGKRGDQAGEDPIFGKMAGGGVDGFGRAPAAAAAAAVQALPPIKIKMVGIVDFAKQIQSGIEGKDEIPKEQLQVQKEIRDAIRALPKDLVVGMDAAKALIGAPIGVFG